MSESGQVVLAGPGGRKEVQAATIVIQPTKGWASLGLHELWEYRDLLYFMVWRDLKSRYRQTALGPVWIVLQPLVSMVLYTVLFGVIAKLPSDNVPYAVFTYVALLPWTFFASAVTSGSSCLIESRDLITKVYFPRLIIPLARLISSLVDFLISLVILAGLLVAYGIRPNAGIVWLPVFLLISAIVGLGVGLWFAGIIVRYRDFGHIAGYMVRTWMYATPVVYSLSVVPQEWLPLYRLNPMTGVIEGFRWALVGVGQPPDVTLLVSTLIFLPILIGGLYTFRRVERNIVDVA